MSKVLVTESYLKDIADAIRAKTGGSDTYTPGEMATGIASIPTGSSAVLVSKTITENGTYDAEDDDADGYSSVTVNVSGGGGALTPYATDIATGYISGNSWFSWRSDYTNCRSDIYQVQDGETYLIAFGATVGTRFRSIFTTTDVTQIPVGTQQTVSGTEIIGSSNPAAFACTAFHVVQNGYIIIFKDNNNTSGIPSYVVPAGFVS